MPGFFITFCGALFQELDVVEFEVVTIEFRFRSVEAAEQEEASVYVHRHDVAGDGRLTVSHSEGW